MNVFDLQAKIGIDSKEFKEGVKNAGDMIKSLGSGVKNIASGIATGIGNMAKITVAGVTAASAGIAAIGKQAVESYAEYEQLVGGVETLFGAGGRSLEEYAESMGTSVDFVRDKYDSLMKSQDMVMENAAKAYMTAGLSANEYMETVTGFSASLLQSLGGDTVKAAEYSDRAIRDMSDNANKMGTSMEAIQNAYAGFSKANYTMLDNLKLGYGGTQEEMKRLIADASQMTKEMNELGISVDGADMSFGNIVNAISVMQKHMDIAGTTEREAASTISGSLNMLKGAWSNLVTGVADDTQDFDKLINNFVNSVDTVAGNILPRVEVALKGVGKLVEKLVPEIMKRIPELLRDTLPSLINSAMNLLSSIGKSLIKNSFKIFDSIRIMLRDAMAFLEDDDSLQESLKKIINVLVRNVPKLLSDVSQIAIYIISDIAESMSENAPKILKAFSEVITDLLDTISILTPIFLELGLTLITEVGKSIVENAPKVLDAFAETIRSLIDTMGELAPTLMDLGFELLRAIGESILENAPLLIDSAITLIEKFADYMTENADKMVGQTILLITKIVEMLTDPEAIGRFVDAAIEITTALMTALLDAIPILLDAAPVIIENLVQAIMENTPKILQLAWDLIKEICNALLANLPQIWEAGKQIIDSLGTGMMSVLLSINDIFKQMHDNAKQKNKEALESYIQLGKDIITNIVVGVTVLLAKVTEVAGNIITTVKAAISAKWEEIKEKGSELIAKFILGIINKYAEIKETGKNIIEKVKDGVTGILDSAKNWGKDLIDNFIGGIKEKWENLKKSVSDVAQSVKDLLGFSEPKEGPLSNFHTYAPDMMDLFAKGIKDNTKKVTGQLEESMGGVKDFFADGTVEVPINVAKGSENAPQSAETITNIFNITVTAGTIGSDYDARRAAQMMAEELGAIKSFQNLAVGGR